MSVPSRTDARASSELADSMSAYVLNTGYPEPQPEVILPIASHLDLVERKLEEAAASEVSVASDLSVHLFSAGGKRVRPSLVILSALASGAEPTDERIVDLAAAAELVHTASLVHDDVVDETSERRGVATASARWGNKMGVLGGDFLLSKAFSLLADIGDLEVIGVLSSVAVRMTEGEMLQAASEGSLASWESSYWRIIYGKTAAFMGACCRCGAILAGADADQRHILSEYGEQLGLAFQITDDLLDMTGNPARTGKDIGADLMNGKYTLPLLLALQKLEGDDRVTVLSAINKSDLTRAEARAVAHLVIGCGAAQLAREAALYRAELASAQLGRLAASEYIAALESLAASVAAREA